MRLHSGLTEFLNQLLSIRSPTNPVHPPIGRHRTSGFKLRQEALPGERTAKMSRANQKHKKLNGLGGERWKPGDT